ncbi:uncharacterized protein DNG_04916 [Cephalotrichum gorgonifer]|uniref:DUF7707 domain-containing protein n=1 Tax=Cephalotrichum gorgonifer TaxID=2041049 RepID=A0AAE8MZG6_9PEZI|nr:uncharacterized protein DNG_04916 [Cephalotrichum gorgonifer]
MPSFKSTILAAALVAVAAADYIIDPETVSKSLRVRWCEDQRNSCPTICASVDDRKVMENECNPETLTYSCICGNGKQPDLSQYTLTLPYYTCTEYGTQCVAACPAHDNECARACREENLCGAQDPVKPSGTPTDDAAQPTATDGDNEDEVFEGLAGDDDKGNAAGRTDAAGLAVLFGGVLAGNPKRTNPATSGLTGAVLLHGGFHLNSGNAHLTIHSDSSTWPAVKRSSGRNLSIPRIR